MGSLTTVICAQFLVNRNSISTRMKSESYEISRIARIPSNIMRGVRHDSRIKREKLDFANSRIFIIVSLIFNVSKLFDFIFIHKYYVNSTRVLTKQFPRVNKTLSGN